MDKQRGTGYESFEELTRDSVGVVGGGEDIGSKDLRTDVAEAGASPYSFLRVGVFSKQELTARLSDSQAGAGQRAGARMCSHQYSL